MSVSSAVGSVTGYFGWALLGISLGWRPALLVAGVLDAISAALMVGMIPTDMIEPHFKLDFAHLKHVITDRALAVLSISLFGLGSAFGLVSNFMIYYLEGNFGLSPGYAGLDHEPRRDTADILRTGDREGIRQGEEREAASLDTRGGHLGRCRSGFYRHHTAAVASVILVGISSGIVFTVGLAAARDIASSNREYESLTVAWVDSFSLFGNFASPLYFSVLVLDFGYPSAWLIGGSVAILLTLPILSVRSQRFLKGRSKPIEVAEPPHL